MHDFVRLRVWTQIWCDVPMSLTWQSGARTLWLCCRRSPSSTLKGESLHSVPLFSDTSHRLMDSLLLRHTQHDFIQVSLNVTIGGSVRLTLHRVGVRSNPSPEQSELRITVPHGKCSALPLKKLQEAGALIVILFLFASIKTVRGVCRFSAAEGKVGAGVSVDIRFVPLLKGNSSGRSETGRRWQQIRSAV